MNTNNNGRVKEHINVIAHVCTRHLQDPTHQTRSPVESPKYQSAKQQQHRAQVDGLWGNGVKIEPTAHVSPAVLAAILAAKRRQFHSTVHISL